ncbi:sodium:glutamate symporter [Anaerosporomusa subterranea]|uniref:Sodium/glutamate symporter n=1 Tax=Anaerosporomusa subterranea TaxID=1794912 RepID=A0A154BN48_ANASB|nr:sodium/glutamate symporter [Anaerosporomusa subterranea]KYZ74948.1 sodium:glutamate symporter [Anaerosporomusa subterranea]
MKFEIIKSVLTFTFDNIGTMTLAAILLMVGYWVKKKVPPLEKFCIPAPVVGGFIFVFINFMFYLSGAVAFKFDSTFMGAFMLAFFTTVGLGASLKVLLTGGKLLLLYWVVNVGVTIMQTGIGIGLGPMVGLHAVYGIISGPIALVGGHGGAAAYGQTLEGMGFPGASLVGLASATFGLVVASLIGGPLGRRLVVQYDLKPNLDDNFTIDTSGYQETIKVEMDYGNTMKNITALLLCMTLGSVIVGWLGKLISMTIPTYVGAMFFAVLVRNLNEKYHFYKYSMEFNDKLGDICLGIYLSMALVTLKLWELAELALPLIIVLCVQTVVLVVLTYIVIFRILGKNYDAAVMCSGLIGHDIGSTPTAVANMTTIMEKYGPSRKALIIVPIVGAFLIDVFYQPFVIWCINIYAK